MSRGIAWYLVVPLFILGLIGCRFVEEREQWRAEAEEQCLAQRLVQPSAYLEPSEAVNGRGTCGMTKPFKVAAVSGGFVEFKPKATLSCPLVANVEAWFHEAIQPAAMAWYGSPVIEIKQISAYSCRTMNGQPGAAISEHAFGNALDIAAFRFADGREVELKTGWKGKPEERGFLRAVHAAACERFSTVLAPGADMFHYDHIHVDLARRSSGRGICKPGPMTLPTPAPRAPESIPMVRGPSPYPTAQTAPQVASASPTSPWINQTPREIAARIPSNPQPSTPSTSPWAQGAPQALPRSVQGPAVVQRREPARAAVGEPLVLSNQNLGNQAPPPNTFGTQPPLADRVRQSLGAPVPDARPMPQPAPQPGYQNPYRLLPPGRIPNASLGSDPTVTGSIGSERNKPANDKVTQTDKNASLLSPRSFAEELPSSEAASVFNLPRTR
jgi:hypothetical protein